MHSVKILIVEDDPHFGQALLEVFSEGRYQARLAITGAEALAAVEEERFDVVVQDVKLPDANGVELLQELLARQPWCGSLVMTAYSAVDDAVAALKLGAFDYLTKPFRMETLFLKIENYLRTRKSGGEAIPCAPAVPFPQVVTRSPAMQAALRTAAKAASATASVLLVGEAGTGKELLASALHNASMHRKGPFVAVDCAAIPAASLERELFGLEGGAYTGDQGRPGYLESAGGGTLFLKHVSELPMELQGKVLRALEAKEVRRVGGSVPRKVEFRLISSTTRDLTQRVQEKRFRSDLYYRIGVVQLRIPALRDRRDDIPLLLAHFLNKARRSVKATPDFTAEAMAALCAHDFPGNVRELKNLVAELVAQHRDGKILPGDLFPQAPCDKGEASAGSSETPEALERGGEPSAPQHAAAQRPRNLVQKILTLSPKALWKKLKP